MSKKGSESKNSEPLLEAGSKDSKKPDAPKFLGRLGDPRILACLAHHRAEVAIGMDLSPRSSPKAMGLYQAYKLSQVRKLTEAVFLQGMSEHLINQIRVITKAGEEAVKQGERPHPYLKQALELQEKLDKVVGRLKEL